MSGNKNPGSKAEANPIQKKILGLLREKLDKIRDDVNEDPDKVKKYASELKKVLAAFNVAPHSEAFSRHSAQIEEQLNRASEAADKMEGHKAASELVKAIKMAYSFISELLE